MVPSMIHLIVPSDAPSHTNYLRTSSSPSLEDSVRPNIILSITRNITPYDNLYRSSSEFPSELYILMPLKM